MSGAHTGDDVTAAEFAELVQRPYSQPTLARLFERWFGYSLSGSYAATEVRSASGETIALLDLYAFIQKDAARRAALREAVLSLRK